VLAVSTAVKKRKTALDKIVVKRPMPPPELLQGAAQAPPTAVNPEFEQKPLAELNLQTSEDFHGGSELTFSMPQRGGRGEIQQQTPAGQESGGASQQRGGGDADARRRQGLGNGQKQQSEAGSKGAQQERETAEASAEETAEAEGGGEEESAEEGGGGQTGVFNTAQAVDVEPERLQRSDLRRLQTEFYRVLEMLAEEKTKHFDPSLVGGLVKAEYDVKKMALRRYEGKPPTKYKAPRVREAVVLVLDNSGSMVEWADMLRAMAELAARRRDVEVYLAPNGYVEEQIAPVRRRVNHGDFMKKMSGRKIIYVGDFDGANTPIELSWRNEVIWIAPESRYRRFLSHSWVKYDEPKYKGAFIRTFTIDDTLKALKKVLGGTKWIDTCTKCENE